MAKTKEFTVSHGMTIAIGNGFESDKPHFSMTVELEAGDEFYVEVAKAIRIVNGVLLMIPEIEPDVVEPAVDESPESKAA
jgi:hypothetical protein